MRLVGYQGKYGDRVRSNWGDGDTLAEYALGDIVWIPEGCAALLDDRVDRPGLHRIHSAFSIGEDASFYYRTAPMVTTGRGDRLKTLWEICSDRLHVVPGKCDYTAGWTLVHSAAVSAGEPTSERSSE